MKSVAAGVAVVLVGCAGLVTGCEKAPSSSTGTQAAKTPVPQTAATNEPKSATPATPPAAAPAPAPANPIGEPKATTPVNPHELPPSLGEATMENGVMTVAGVALKVPEAWEKADTGNAAIRPAMKFTIAAPAGTSIEPGTVNVFAGIKGTPEQNLSRWLLQMNNIEGKPEKEQFQQNGLTITRLAVVGQYNPGMGMGPGGRQTKDNWAMYGLVISGGPEGDIHILSRGPKEILLRQRENWDAFTKSATPAKGAPAAPAPATAPTPTDEKPKADEPKAAG